MSDHEFGRYLRQLREAAGLSLDQLAQKTSWSKPMLAAVEVGRRPAHRELVEACDRALSTTPLLSLLWDGKGNPVNRRAALSLSTTVVAGATLSTAGLAEIVRISLLSEAALPEDWDEVIAGYARAFVSDPGRDYGPAVLNHLLLLRQSVAETGHTPQRLRAMAGLSHLFGLWCGNQSDLNAAANWYRCAMGLAERSGDTALRAFIQGRVTARTTYEGASLASTERGIAQVLAVAPPVSVGALEAYCAEAQIGALRQDAARGRAAVRQMRVIAEQLCPQEDPWSAAAPTARWAFLHAYVEARCGTLSDAVAAQDTAMPLLAARPTWAIEARLYLSRAMVAAGDHAGGLTHALATVTPSHHDVRVIAFAVSDVLDALPAGYTSDDQRRLTRYASADPGPWHTLR